MYWWGWGCREIGYYPKLGAHYKPITSPLRAHYDKNLAHYDKKLAHQYEFLAHYDKNLALYGGLFPYIFTIFRPYMFIDISYYSLYRIIKKKCLNYYFSIIYTIQVHIGLIQIILGIIIKLGQLDDIGEDIIRDDQLLKELIKVCR